MSFLLFSVVIEDISNGDSDIWSLGHTQKHMFHHQYRNNFLLQVRLARDFPKQARNLRFVCCSVVITKLPSKKKIVKRQ